MMLRRCTNTAQDCVLNPSQIRTLHAWPADASITAETEKQRYRIIRRIVDVRRCS